MHSPANNITIYFQTSCDSQWTELHSNSVLLLTCCCDNGPKLKSETLGTAPRLPLETMSVRFYRNQRFIAQPQLTHSSKAVHSSTPFIPS